MRPTQVSLSAAGFSEPIVHDWYQTPTNITLALYFTGTATASVLYSPDPVSSPDWHRHVAKITQATTVITVVGDPGPPGNGGVHGLAVGDYVQIQGTGAMDGWYPVASVVSATGYTLTSTTSQSAGPSQSGKVTSARVFTHPNLAALTARAVGNLAYPVGMSMLDVTAYSGGTITLEVLQGALK